MAGLPVAMKAVLIACAGVSTFYATAQWSSRHRVTAEGEAAAPAKAVDATVAAIAPMPASRAGAEVLAAPVASAAVARKAGTEERGRTISRALADPFASLSWMPAPPPPPPPPAVQAAPVAAAKPAAPEPPPLPFVFVGMLDRGDSRPAAFLAKGDALLVVAAGERLDNDTYRVDALSADEVVLTYLPLNARQRLHTATGTR